MPPSLDKEKMTVRDKKDDTTRPKKPPPERLFTEIEYVKVGPAKQIFGVHRGLLLYHSRYFKKALTGDFKEATEGVTLDEDDPVTFQMFNLWLYSGKLLSEEQLDSQTEDLTMLLVNACLFADLREIPAMYNCAIDDLIMVLTNPDMWMPTTCVRRIWDNTSEKSTLRLLYVRVLVDKVDVRNLLTSEASSSNFSKQAIRDLAVAYYDRDQDDNNKEENVDFWETRCTYHMHGQNNTSCSDDPSCDNTSAARG